MGTYQHPISSAVEVRPRQVDFHFPDDLPKYWFNDNPYITHFLNALSAVFPEGERFFIETVRHYQGQITDPTLSKEIRGFIGQEAHHGNQHELFNSLQEKHGLPLGRISTYVKNRLAGTRTLLNPEQRLAITIALEHFTAILAHQVLADPAFTRGAPESVQNLFLWHAIEETEHKAVAFDVYRAIGGSDKVRRIAMARTTVFFLSHIFAFQLVLLWKDGMPIRPLKFLESLNFLVGKPGLFRRIARDYVAYYRKDFHPWQQDNRDLIANWKQRFAGVASAVLA